MIGYIDSSVIIANIFSESGAISKLEAYGALYSSRLLQTECLRVLVGKFLNKKASEEQFARMKDGVLTALSGIKLLQLDEPTLLLAETPFSVNLATLDSIHLASALRLKSALPGEELHFLTHDERLGRAAQVMGLQVLGIS
ncbi:MAG: type II toxin-antitoxin system VapC family toxin [Deltaproteobacteria bacterium]|nr:type II toxin-antitoxin system VapC family toxin [Deltaproteobacteria bacterium]